MPDQKRILINGTLADGISRAQFVDWVHEHKVSPEAWELVQQRILVEPMFKVGESVGLVAFMDCETEAEALDFLDDLPAATGGMLEFTAEKVSRVARFDPDPAKTV